VVEIVRLTSLAYIDENNLVRLSNKKDAKPKLKLFSSIQVLRKMIKPPYSKKSLLLIAGTLLLLVSIPLTVYFAQQRLNLNSKAAANTLIVGSGGYSTITAAVNAAVSGDLILIKAGTYNEEVNVTKPLAFDDFGDGQVWVSGNCSRNSGFVVDSISNVSIKDIGIKKTKGPGIYLSDADNITIDSVRIQDYNCLDGQDQYMAGVASWGGGKNLTVKNSTIIRRVELSGTLDGFGNGVWVKNSSSTDGGGHYFGYNTIIGGYDGFGGEPEDVDYGSFNKNTIIENNTITDCGDDGIQSEGGNQNNIIRNNIIKRCLIGIAFTPSLTGPLTILRNVITEPVNRYGLGSAMFKMGDGSVGQVKIYHNSFYAGSTISDGPKQTNGGGLSNLDFKNNAIYASRYVYETGESPTGTSNYSALFTTDSTRFIKWAGTTYGSLSSFRSSTGQELNGITTSDFGWDTATLQLKLGSPLIDKATVIAGINDGYVGAAPDIGAFEFGSQTQPPTGKTGDLNGDNQVNILDLSILLSSWNTTNSAADLNKDGLVNILDLSLLLSKWGS